MRRKRDNLSRHFPTGSPQHAELLANFRQQMADVARGAKFRELREERHWSQETAAHEIGVSVKSVRSWEKGGPIKWSNAKKAGRAYGVDPHELTEHESVSDEEEAEPRETDDETRQILVGMQAQIRERLKPLTARPNPDL